MESYVNQLVFVGTRDSPTRTYRELSSHKHAGQSRCDLAFQGLGKRGVWINLGLVAVRLIRELLRDRKAA
jgi:hypothetical protein